MKIAIIGGGGTGLAAAYDLARANHDVVVYEAGAEVGGLAAGFRDERWEWSVEKFYHHWFSSDSDVLELVEEIGHTDKVLFPFPTTSLWTPDGNIPIAGKVVNNTFLSLIANVLGITPLPLIREGLDAIEHLPVKGVVLNGDQVSIPRWVQKLIPGL